MFERHGSTHSCRSQTLGRYERKNAWCFAHYKMSFRLNVTGRGKLRRGQAHEDRPCRGLEDFVLRHRETVLRNKKERKKERKGELKSALKALIKGQEKKSSLTQMQSPSSSQLFRCGLTAFFGWKKLSKLDLPTRKCMKTFQKKSKKIHLFFNQKLFKNA